MIPESEELMIPISTDTIFHCYDPIQDLLEEYTLNDLVNNSNRPNFSDKNWVIVLNTKACKRLKKWYKI
jgi:hypothetical protein